MQVQKYICSSTSLHNYNWIVQNVFLNKAQLFLSTALIFPPCFTWRFGSVSLVLSNKSSNSWSTQISYEKLRLEICKTNKEKEIWEMNGKDSLTEKSKNSTAVSGFAWTDFKMAKHPADCIGFLDIWIIWKTNKISHNKDRNAINLLWHRLESLSLKAMLASIIPCCYYFNLSYFENS